MTEIYQCSVCEWCFDGDFKACPHCEHEIGNSRIVADTSDHQRISELEQDSERHQKAIVEGLEAVKGYINRVSELEQQLAAMTAERDAALGRCKVVERAFFVGLQIALETSGAFSSDEIVQNLIEAAIRGAEGELEEEQAKKEIENE